MGQADRTGKKMDAALLWTLIRPQPRSLSAEEARMLEDPMRSPQGPVRALAWLRFPTGDGDYVVQLLEWNGTAVRVEGMLHGANVFRAIVYRGALSPRGSAAGLR
ncbi:hypothetical protein ACFOYW_17065 [Gryllotalpicola reticulitermitis]|uniref:Uncharacterized protein n=1 Tax=Gryllotalpicola reticulitermitis TaxID=1184153 RepID=A0ABV8Q9M6_9MICO